MISVEVPIKTALQMGVMHHKAGRTKEAGAIYQMVLEDDPENTEALNLLGVIFFQSKKFKTAVGLIRRAIELKPDNAAYYNNLGNTLCGSGELDEAVVVFRKALELKPDYAECHSNLILAMDLMPNMDNAMLQAERRRWAEAHANKFYDA